MATSEPEMNQIFCVRGTIPHPRSRPRKVTNSEKTSTTNNLSQHKYQKLKRQLQGETDNTLISTGDAKFQNRNQPLTESTVTVQHDKSQKCASNPAASYSMQHHQYKLVSDWDSQWHTLYHHFTTCHQHRYPSSYQAGSARAQATSHLQPESSDLPKLLTSTRLSLQVPPNQQNRPTALCNYSQHPPHTDSSAINDEFEDQLCYDQSQSVESTPGNFDSCSNDNCTSHAHYLPMTCTDSLIMSRVYMSSADRAASTVTAGTRRTSWYSEYLRATLQRMHARSRNERRKKTKSAPGGSVSLLAKESKQKGELVTSTAITYFSAHRDVKRPSREHGAVDIALLKAEKAKEVLSKPPPLYKPDPKPRSHWYEMRTPEFHREAKRNNILIRKSCNW